MADDPTTLEPTCPPSKRPQALFDTGATVHGLRAAQSRVQGGQRFVDLWLYHDPPAALTDEGLWTFVPSPGGADVSTDLVTVEAAPTPHLRLRIVGSPDPSRYRLQVDRAAAALAGVQLDPLRTWLPVRLRPECPDLGSCFAVDDPPPAAPPSPVHDYLARDWRSLRRALVEYLVRRQPDADLSIADPTITVLELFAHAGDLLHYRLDRVATEAYLETARLRTSVRRHARLVDFAFSDGVSADTFVFAEVPPRGADVPIAVGDVAVDIPDSDLAFTLDEGTTARASLSEIPIYDWGEEACCLPAGATECVLVRPKPADPLGDPWLTAGDLLAFEVVDPDDAARHRTWATRGQDWPTDADSRERFREPLPSRTAQVVRLIAAERFTDPLLGAGLPLLRVRWRPEDALVRGYPVGVDSSAGGDEVTVARANVVPAHHGRLVDGPGTLEPRATARAPQDGNGAEPAVVAEYALRAAGSPRAPGLAAGPGLSFRADGRPHRLDVAVTLASGVVVDDVPVLRTLIEQAPGDLGVVVDVEEQEPPILRFRTGAVGTAPPLGSTVEAAYEVGSGAAGNIPANGLQLLERNSAAPGATPAWDVVQGLRVRNPQAGAGGVDPTPLDEVRRDAPEAFAVEPRRAVLPADYAAAAAESPLVERAMARRSWSGSWPLVTAVVDLTPGAATAEAAADASIRATLDDLRMLGTEVAVVAGTPIGLLISLDVCVRPGADPEAARLEILRALRPGTSDRPGFFSPTRLRLGTAVYLSGVLAAAAAVPAVDAVEAREARRLNEPKGTVHQVLEFAPDEVPVLDDDPARPERGRLDLRLRGGS